MESIWRAGMELPKFQALQGDVKTDVLIIGGGLAGILCAKFLQERGVDYVLAEGRSICAGVTGNTTAKITSQHGLIYDKMLRSKGEELTKMYLDANEAALEKYAELAKDMDCDFERKNSYVYSLKDTRKLEKEVDALQSIGVGAKLTETGELPFLTAGAVCFERQAQFNPLKFVANIAQGLNIYEGTWVRELTDELAVTNRGLIYYKRIVFATHFPIDNKHGMYFLKMYQHRSYVSAYKNASYVEGMYMDESKSG
ncbi:MAG: FAD-binding oxidoreductase, partial [Lachnospira sp.]|nr:FAD-binding oxidoreductase [Lachnospira sp.]